MEREDGIKFQVGGSRADLIIGAAAVIFAAGLPLAARMTPPAETRGVLLALAVVCALMVPVSIYQCALYYIRKIIVAETDIYYVNWMGRQSHFTLDDIGYGKVSLAGDVGRLEVLDLRGERLVKLNFMMRGADVFFQYLLDNHIAISTAPADGALALLHRRRNASGGAGRTYPNDHSRQFWDGIEASCAETSVCPEEIGKCMEKLCGEIAPVICRWEKQNERFGVRWEYGLAQYRLGDLQASAEGRMRECPSSFDESAELPPDYLCMLEAYLQKDGAYVVSRQGCEVGVSLVYLVRTASLQVGEQSRIRKSDEQIIKRQLEERLAVIAAQLPKHKYHTEHPAAGHALRR